MFLLDDMSMWMRKKKNSVCTFFFYDDDKDGSVNEIIYHYHDGCFRDTAVVADQGHSQTRGKDDVIDVAIT